MRHNTLITTRARALRKNMSDPEVILWTRLRGRHAERPTFRRQHPVGSIIVDFYCPSARLVIEVDGSTHWDPDQRAKDAARDRWLWRQGLTVIRIPASMVYNDSHGAADWVIRKAQELIAQNGLAPRLAPSTAGSPLRSAGGPPPAAPRGR